MSRPETANFDYVVTPNVDHIVRIADPAGKSLLRVYREVFLCLCDSRILARLAAARGVRLPVVPGSDLTLELFRGSHLNGQRVAIVGSTAAAIQKLRAAYPLVSICHHQPPMGLRSDPRAMDAAVEFVEASRARFVMLAVGSPQQELLAYEIKKRRNACGLGLCIGASIDFVTGLQKRAPRLVQHLHLEWAYRLASDPRRLWRRYLLDGPRIFLAVARWTPGERRTPTDV